MERRTELWIVGGFVIVIILIAIGAFLLPGAAPSNQAGFVATKTTPLGPTDHVRGDATSSTSVIEYGDFECPACGAYEPMVEQLTQQYGNRVAFAFRNFPLPQHQDAQIAAQAAEAAALQGKYWEMHDLLYSKQNEWVNEPASTVVSKYFNGYAQSLGMNVAQFDQDINSTQVKQKIQNDMALANAAQVDHTPTFFIDDVQIPNPQSLQEFQKDINAALASSSATTTAQ